LALPAGAFCAYYATAAWLKAREWWEKDRIDHKISYGDKRAVDTTLFVPAIIQANSGSEYASGPIMNVPVGYASKASVEFTARYGKNQKHLNRRWFVKAEQDLPPQISGLPYSEAESWTLLRNDLETLMD
jgi:hypothetical protein